MFEAPALHAVALLVLGMFARPQHADTGHDRPYAAAEPSAPDEFDDITLRPAV